MSKVSAKSVIEDGIKTGKSTTVILSTLAKKVPDSKADESHIRFYANAMLRAGTLNEDVARDKYGCGARGRKPAEAKTKGVKAKKATDAAPAVKAKVKVKKIADAAEEPKAKKLLASTKSVKSGSPKTSSTRKITSKA